MRIKEGMRIDEGMRIKACGSHSVMQKIQRPQEHIAARDSMRAERFRLRNAAPIEDRSALSRTGIGCMPSALLYDRAMDSAILFAGERRRKWL